MHQKQELSVFFGCFWELAESVLGKKIVTTPSVLIYGKLDESKASYGREMGGKILRRLMPTQRL